MTIFISDHNHSSIFNPRSVISYNINNHEFHLDYLLPWINSGSQSYKKCLGFTFENFITIHLPNSVKSDRFTNYYNCGYFVINFKSRIGWIRDFKETTDPIA